MVQKFKRDAKEFYKAKKRNEKWGDISVPKTWIHKTNNTDGKEQYIEIIFTYMIFNDELYILSIDRDVTDRCEASLKLDSIRKCIENEISISEVDKDKLLKILN